MNYMINRNKQGGFVQAIALALILVISVSVLLWRSNQTSSGSSSEQSAKADASSVIFQAGNIKGSIDTLLLANNDISNVVLCENDNLQADCSTAGAGLKGVFNPAHGAGSRQAPPSSAINDATSQWQLKRSIVGVGAAPVVSLGRVGSASADWVVHLPNVKDVVCKQINYQILGKPATEDSNILAGMDAARYNLTAVPALADWTTAATAVDLSTGLPAGNSMPTAGCVKTGTADGNVFYQVVMVK